MEVVFLDAFDNKTNPLKIEDVGKPEPPCSSWCASAADANERQSSAWGRHDFCHGGRSRRRCDPVRASHDGYSHDHTHFPPRTFRSTVRRPCPDSGLDEAEVLSYRVEVDAALQRFIAEANHDSFTAAARLPALRSRCAPRHSAPLGYGWTEHAGGLVAVGQPAGSVFAFDHEMHRCAGRCRPKGIPWQSSGCMARRPGGPRHRLTSSAAFADGHARSMAPTRVLGQRQVRRPNTTAIS